MRRRDSMRSGCVFFLVLALGILPVFFRSPNIAARTPVADLWVYNDALAAGWQDWSYNDVSVDYANMTPALSGTHSIAVTYTGGWSGVQIGYGGAHLDVSAYDTLRFWIHGGATGGQPVYFTAHLRSGEIERALTPQAGAWTQIDISLLEYATRELYSLEWFNNSGSAQSPFYIDSIVLVDTGAAPPPTPTPATGPALSVDAAADQHPISPYIYGMNYADDALAQTVRLPLQRWGGNSTTRYNWEINVHNTGSDWYFENIPDADSDSADAFVLRNKSLGVEPLLTVPLIGWTPKRRTAGHPFDCGFPRTAYPNQDSFDPWDTNCGNGEWQEVPITGNDPLWTSKVITEAFVTTWIEHLVATHGAAVDGGVKFYDLDNEPMLWNSTHRDVHPAGTTYDEMRERTYAYAAAIKAADPTAQTLGPVTWGWCAYFYSGADGCGPGADYAAHGNLDFTTWYLKQMQAYEDTHGVRILDYLDLHYYPQANGVALAPAGNAATQALRLRSTRSLWDTTYIDESWISDTTDEPVQMIPRMKQWVANNYPGTKLAITEYNWGALDHINGALAQADVLGIFGREGLDLATLWGPPEANEPGAYAFRMYRNYDGLGSAFGDVSVQASSTDQDQVAIYAARRSVDQALTLMVIDKTAQAYTSTVSLANFQPAGNARVYRYSAANLTAIVREADQPVAGTTFTATFPGNSITLLVLMPGGPLEGVSITGPVFGVVDMNYTFTATVSPSTAMPPITYTWTPSPVSGQATATATYRWDTPGAKTITVTAQNVGGLADATHSIMVSIPHRIYLPLVLR